MTGYTITPESSISGNWMDFILIYTLSFSLTHRLNPCMGFHPLPSPPITHFTLIIIKRSIPDKCKESVAFKNWLYVSKEIINYCMSVVIASMKMCSSLSMPRCSVTLQILDISKNWMEMLYFGCIPGTPLMGVKLLPEQASTLQEGA